MKALLRLLGSIVAAFFILVFLTLIVGFIRKFWFSDSGLASRGHVAVLDVIGEIDSASDTLRNIEEILKEKSAKALVVRVNSPGGMVAPSQEIFEALKRADKKIPVIVSMSSVAASGGYYLALGARELFADPGTLTASIGVIMEFTNASKLFEWAKVQRFTLTAGKLKDAGSPTRPMTQEERDFFSAMLTDVHRQFRTAVKERRHLSQEELDAVADGRVMTGQQAFDAKLIDHLGGFDDAVKEAKHLAGLAETAPVEFPDDDETGILRKLLLGKPEASWDHWLKTFSEIAGRISPPPASGWKILLRAPVQG